MKNKWILNFLLIALSFNAVSPLLAMGKQNESFIEDSTSLLKLNPLPAIKNCWNGFVDSASNNFNSITESASKNNVLAMLGRGAKEVGSAFSWLGGGLASFAGKIPGHYFQKPETLEGFNKGTALFDIALGISAYLTIKNYWTLYRIGRKITRSKDAAAEGKKFLFGSWKCKTYETCLDLFAHAETVKRDLLAEIRKKPSRIHILDDAGKRIDPGNVITEENIRNALYNEQKMLRTYLTKTISRFTDASLKILELIDNKHIDPDLWYPEAAFDERCFNHLAQLDKAAFDEFKELLKKKCNSYFGIKRLLFTPPGGWKFYPQYWRLFPCYNKATEVFWTVYTCYLRTHTLLEIINKPTTISISQQELTLGTLSKQVDDLIKAQKNAYTNEDTKSDQITCLKLAWNAVKELKKIYEQQKNDAFVIALVEINGHFKDINSILLNTKEKPETDTAKRLLKCVKKNLETLINPEN